MLLPARGAARIAGLRLAIDAVNQEMLALLEKRGRLVVEIMQLKHELGLHSYDPDRERQMIAALLRSSTGVYSAAALERVFAGIFEASRGLGSAGNSERTLTD